MVEFGAGMGIGRVRERKIEWKGVTFWGVDDLVGCDIDADADADADADRCLSIDLIYRLRLKY